MKSFAIRVHRIDGKPSSVVQLDPVHDRAIIDDYLSTNTDDLFLLRSHGEWLTCLRAGPSVAHGVGARLATVDEATSLPILGRD